MNNDELCHYGVLGMKWGVRHDRRPTGRVISARTNLNAAKAAKKEASKAYSKAFNKSSTLYGAYGPGNKQRHATTYRMARKSAAADNKYRSAKKQYKEALNSYNRHYKKIDREIDKELYGDHVVKNINRKMNKGSSLTSARLREYGKLAVIGSLMGIGATSVDIFLRKRR